MVEQSSKKPRLPDIPRDMPDDAFLVLVIDAGRLRKLAKTLKNLRP
jgi:hypothetical protein